MSFMDDCEERAFEHGRSIAIEGFTVKELTTELCKREGVSSFKVNKGTLCYDITSDEARILVVNDAIYKP